MSINGRIIETDGRTNGLVLVLSNGQTDEWMDGWKDRWMDGRIDGWINRQIDSLGVFLVSAKNAFVPVKRDNSVF